MFAKGTNGQGAGEGGAQDQSIDDLLASLPRSFWKEGAKPLTGGLLLLALRARIDRVAIVGSLREEVADYFKVGDDLLNDVIAFADEILMSCQMSSPPSQDVASSTAVDPQLVSQPSKTALCRGLSCMLNGAKRWHATFEEILKSSGLQCEVERVFCLSQCDLGPSVMHGKSIWVGRGQQVILDSRGWRDEESGSGPIAVDSHTPPVRD